MLMNILVFTSTAKVLISRKKIGDRVKKRKQTVEAKLASPGKLTFSKAEGKNSEVPQVGVHGTYTKKTDVEDNQMAEENETSRGKPSVTFKVDVEVQNDVASRGLDTQEIRSNNHKNTRPKQPSKQDQNTNIEDVVHIQDVDESQGVETEKDNEIEKTGKTDVEGNQVTEENEIPRGQESVTYKVDVEVQNVVGSRGLDTQENRSNNHKNSRRPKQPSNQDQNTNIEDVVHIQDVDESQGVETEKDNEIEKTGKTDVEGNQVTEENEIPRDPYRIVSHRFISPRIASYRTVEFGIVSQKIISKPN
ncbi:hypothetical protein QZH41_007201 [Actinostola sp. cb2023]|nr:hypothetical protein QZH41_007201 [Actinostola sp. cb2023]